jgi:2-dehydropantoate 2-reductase
VHPDIRQEIWTKLWGNLSFNPLSVLTGGTLAEIAQDPGTRSVVRRMMAEAEQVANAIGITFPIDIETRIERANSVGAHKSSMLQDYECGRPLEVDALLTAVIEIGRAVGADTPLLDTIHALLIQRAKTAGCLPERD